MFVLIILLAGKKSHFACFLLCVQDKMETEYPLEKNDTRRVSFVSIKQTVTSTSTLLTSPHVAFTACDLFLSYCFSCILCFCGRCVWSHFWDSLAGILTKKSTLSLSLFLSTFSWVTLCTALPYCLILSVFLTHKTEDVDGWRTTSKSSSPEHADSDYSEKFHPSPFRKYKQSVQTLKPIRWSSPQSVLFSTYSALPVLLHTLLCCYTVFPSQSWYWVHFLRLGPTLWTMQVSCHLRPLPGWPQWCGPCSGIRWT